LRQRAVRGGHRTDAVQRGAAGGLPLVALALSGIGIYGVTARSREIGIRIALGAEHTRVRRMIVGEGIALAAVGAVLGAAGAFAATRVLGTLLLDVAPTDPATYLTILVVLGGRFVRAIRSVSKPS
jgi:ABC-type antimicrobial peptide transport system permease subunit